MRRPFHGTVGPPGSDPALQGLGFAIFIQQSQFLIFLQATLLPGLAPGLAALFFRFDMVEPA